MGDVSASYDIDDATFYVTTDVTTYRRPRVDALYLRMRSVINVLLPVVFGAGVAGNALNAVLLTRRRGSSINDGGSGVRSGRPTMFERSAMAGLVALSASDFLFCLVGFAEVLFVGTPRPGSWRAVARLYYDVYCPALMNLFLFSSTWLIALVSVERCLAVCYPFHAGALIRVRRTVAAHVVVFVVSALLNVPLFLRSTVVTQTSVACVDGGRADLDDVNSTVASVTPPVTTAVTARDDASSCAIVVYNIMRPTMLIVSRPGFFYVHKVIWFAVGTFLPLLLIVYSNVRLIREICRMRRKSSAAAASSSSRSASKAQLDLDRDKSSTVTLTLTLIAIGVCFLLLVCPSISVQFWRFANYATLDGYARPSYPGRAEAMAIMVTNLTQAVKFSSNFLLYCVVSRSFRRTFSRLLGTQRCAGRGGSPGDDRSRPERVCNAALIDPPADNIDDTGV